MEKTERKEREFNLRRAEILMQAERVFAAKGFYKTTVAEIADASGFAVGTLYQFFESKEDLFAAMILEKLERFYGDVRTAVTRRKNTVDKIKALVNARFLFVGNNLDFCAIFIRGEGTTLAEGNSDLRERMIADYLDHIAFIESFLAEGVEAGILRGMGPRLMAIALTGMINSFTFSWMHTPGSGLLTEKAELVVDIFLKGVIASASGVSSEQ